MKIPFIRKIELYESRQLHYIAECSTKEEAALVIKAWELRGNTYGKVKRYKKEKYRNTKHLTCYQLYKKDESILLTLWLPSTVGYYLKCFWLTKKEAKVIQTEYIHHRWPKDYFEKQIIISRPTKAITGL